MVQLSNGTRRVIYILPLIYLLYIGLILLTQRSMMYFPQHAISAQDMTALKDFTPTTVKTADGLKVTGYFYPPKDTQPIIIMFHGNASNPSWEVFKTDQLRPEGYGVMLAGYRGYGGNPGTPSEKGLYADAEAYYAWVKENYPAHPVVFYGESLGSGVAVEMSLRHSPEAMVLEVPFKSALSVAERLYWFIPLKPLLMLDPYRSDLKVGHIKAPSLFLIAAEDEVVTAASGLELFALANEPKTKVVLPHATHASIYEFGAQPELRKFLEGVFKK